MIDYCEYCHAYVKGKPKVVINNYTLCKACLSKNRCVKKINGEIHYTQNNLLHREYGPALVKDEEMYFFIDNKEIRLELFLNKYYKIQAEKDEIQDDHLDSYEYFCKKMGF